MIDREKVIKALDCCWDLPECDDCPYHDEDEDGDDVCRMGDMHRDAMALLKAQKARVMTAEEVAACSVGTVLWVEEHQGVTWNLFPLEIETRSTHPDTGTDYLFFITYNDIRKFECTEYNEVWRCWTNRPTDEQMEAAPWD